MKNYVRKRPIWNLLFLLCFTFGVALFANQNVHAAVAPAAPTGLAQTDADTSSVDIAWNPVSGNDVTYYYRISENTAFTNAEIDYEYDCTAYISGLQLGKTYYVQIGASDNDKEDNEESDITWSKTILTVATAPEQVTKSSVKITTAKETSVSFKWSAASGATGYRIEYYAAGSSSSTAKTISTAATSITVPNLSKNKEYEFCIYSYRAAGSFKSSLSYGPSFYAAVLPTKVTGVDCSNFDPSVKKGDATFDWKINSLADGYQYEIYTYNGKSKLVSGTTTSYSYVEIQSSKLKTRQYYRIRVRAYYINHNNTKQYGAWSSFDYFSRSASQDVTLKKSGGKIKASWSKVKGATGYTVYLSTNGTSYKKMGTTAKTTLKIKQSLKTGKSYYVRIVPYYKKGKTTYTATVNLKYFYSAWVYNGKYTWYTYKW